MYRYSLALTFVLVIACSGLAKDIGKNLQFGTFQVQSGELVAFEGDSLTYGFDASPTGGNKPINGSGLPRSAKPFPELVGIQLGNKIRVENRGYPGDQTIDGISRWRAFPKAAVLFVMYGTNDFGNFGHSSRGSIPADRYKIDLETLIKEHCGPKTKVILILPPPLEDPIANEKLELYRRAAAEVAASLNVPIIDSPAVLTGVANKWTDGLHLSIQSNATLMNEIMRHIVVAANPPQ